jgi:hypothetical protein
MTPGDTVRGVEVHAEAARALDRFLSDLDG